MTDYKVSHVGAGRGRIYDCRYGEGAEKFYWENLEKPYLERLFAQLNATHGGRFLDFATGTGRILQIAASRFDDCVGIDVSQDMLAEAARKVPKAKLVCADVTAETVDVGMFSVVSCFRFVLNAQPVLREQALNWIRQRIKTNGVLIINNHMNKWSLTGALCRFSNRIRREPRHNVLGDREIQELVQRCGFRVYAEYAFGVIPAWRNRLLLGPEFVCRLEKGAARLRLTRRLGKDKIYLCQPV